MSEKFNVQVDTILVTLKSKLCDQFNRSNLDRKVILQLAQELGLIERKQGRNGGTFATETGMAFANLSGEIIKPVINTKKTDTSELTPAMTEAVSPVMLSQSEVP